MQPTPGEALPPADPDSDELSVERAKQLMRQIRKGKAARHAKSGLGPGKFKSPVTYALPSEDPVGDLCREVARLAEVMREKLPGGSTTASADCHAEQPISSAEHSSQPPQWLSEYLTRQGAKLVLALWGKEGVSPTELWKRVWEREDRVIRETIESAVKRANADLSELPPEITSTYHIAWNAKKLRLVVDEGEGFKNEPNAPQKVSN